jgi:hypothetical protein
MSAELIQFKANRDGHVVFLKDYRLADRTVVRANQRVELPHLATFTPAETYNMGRTAFVAFGQSGL